MCSASRPAINSNRRASQKFYATLSAEIFTEPENTDSNVNGATQSISDSESRFLIQKANETLANVNLRNIERQRRRATSFAHYPAEHAHSTLSRLAVAYIARTVPVFALFPVFPCALYRRRGSFSRVHGQWRGVTED